MSNVSLTAKMLGWEEFAATAMNVLSVLIVMEEFIWVHRLGTIVTLCRWPAKQTIPLSVLARNQTKGFWTWNLGVAGRGNRTREESWLEKGADKELATGQQRDESAEDRVQRRRSSQDVGIPVALWNFR